MSYFNTPEEVIDYWYESFNEAKGNLGLSFVGYSEEKLVPKYPAMMIGDIIALRDIHATRQFLVNYQLNMFVYHAKLTESRRARVRSDLLLVTNIRNHFHADKECQLNRNGDGPGVIFGHVTDESPGLIQRGKGDAVVGTRMSWTGRAINTF